MAWTLLYMYKDWIDKYPFILIPLIFIFEMKRNRERHDKPILLNKWVAAYVVSFTVFVILGVIYISINSSNFINAFGIFEVLSAFLLLVLPILIIYVKESYVNAGNKN